MFEGGYADPSVIQKRDSTYLIEKFQVLSITKDSGSRVSGGSVPFIMKLEDDRFRLYYCGRGGIISAISTDGLDFEKEPGIRIGQSFSDEFENVVCDPTLVKLSDIYYGYGIPPSPPGTRSITVKIKIPS